MLCTKLTLVGLTAVDLNTFGALPTDPFILKGVDGLGPPKVTTNIVRGRNRRSTPQSKNPDDRQIVAKVGLNPDWASGQSVSDLRTMLYGLLTGGTNEDVVEVIVYDGEDELFRADGWVSGVDPSIFSSDPEVQVVVDCFDSYFITPDLVHPTLASLSKSAPEIINVGTAPSGLFVDITFTGTVSNFKITSDTGEYIGFDYDFHSGDRLTFNTRPGYRDAKVDPSGAPPIETLLGKLTSGFKWVGLHGGVNNFVTTSSSFNWNDVYYQAQHWGI